jgi:alkyl hydroperoxide reductase subunit AhpC
MSLRLEDTAPDFTAPSSMGTIHFHEYINNSWAMLFSHPADFTPVCTTELGRTSQLFSEFEKRSVKVLALSVDSVDNHLQWINDINNTQHTVINFPILADIHRQIAILYGMIPPNASETYTVRSLFIIDPHKKIKLIINYPASTGRNFHEILRVIDSLQLAANHNIVTPADWQAGDDVILPPSISTEEAKAMGHTNIQTVTSYLRYIPAPKN